MIRGAKQLEELLELRLPARARRSLLDVLGTHSAVLEGHFGLHRKRHTNRLLRFRGIGRDTAARLLVTNALLDQLPEPLGKRLAGAKILSPETAGFFLGTAIAKRYALELVVTQTDLRRLPAKHLLAGTLLANDRVVIVNDVTGTGASIETLRELVAERHAKLQGILLFGVIDEAAFREYCAQLDVPSHWLVTAQWRPYTHTPEVDCPGCQAAEELISVGEIV